MTLSRVIAFLAVIVILAGIVLFVLFHKSTPSPSATTPIGFPIASSTPGSVQTTTTLGENQQAVTVQDFIHASGTVADPYTKGEYVLADDCDVSDSCTAATHGNGFRIVYDERDQSFNVLLLAEPLRETRLSAQAFLATVLGVPPVSLCTLTHTVGTINAVNGVYAGQELNFPVCTGAVVLP